MSWVLAALCSVGFATAAARRRWRVAAALLALSSLAYVVASVSVRGLATMSYGGEACTPTCEVAAGGWPVPWAADNPGLSPAGSVAADEVLGGVDEPLWGAFLVDLLAFALLQALAFVAAATLLDPDDDAPRGPPPGR